ncbi:EXS family-domain-containing protein [Circinella umbellata]|nr:EXS family-domain-containing protein [Circinella umbellata]
MPFAAYLEKVSIPEWRKAYIDYKGLCAILEIIQKKRFSSSTSKLDSNHLNDEQLLYQSPSSFIRSPISSRYSHHISNRLSETAASRALTNTIEQERSQLDEHDRLDLGAFYNTISHASKDERLFFFKLDEQLDRISRFYNERENEVKSKMDALKIQMDLVADYGRLLMEERQQRENNLTQEGEENSNHHHTPSCWFHRLNPFYWFKKTRQAFNNNTNNNNVISGLPLPPPQQQQQRQRLTIPNIDFSAIPLQYAKNDKLSYQVARGRLKRAVAEFYRNLELLQSYKEINLVGFQSILKKFDRIAGWQAKKQYMEKVKTFHWASSQDLEKMMEDTIVIFADEFANNNRVKSARSLKTSREQKSFTAASWRVGFYFGAALILLLADINLVSDPGAVDHVSYIHTHLQIYACFSVPILFALGVSINMMVWTRSKVNYKFIFELDPKDNLDYHQFAELPCFMLLLLTTFMFLDFSNILDPWWLCRSLGRIIFSYFFPVEFRDFFIADELNSLSYSFWTLSYLFCAYTWNWTGLESDYRCHVTHMWITPFLAALAPWWRFLQCIRRYQDSSERVHLINAAKYTSTIVATFATGLRRIHPSPGTDMLWILASMINSSYTSIWDIKMDWGLLQPASRHFLLRDDLVFYKWVYYVAAPLNVMLRFAWAINTAGLTLHSDVIGYFTALMEACRRIQWNFFRLENEHFNNCADYRAINEIPLPFAMTTTLEGDLENGKPYDRRIRLFTSSDEEEPIEQEVRGDGGTRILIDQELNEPTLTDVRRRSTEEQVLPEQGREPQQEQEEERSQDTTSVAAIKAHYQRRPSSLLTGPQRSFSVSDRSRRTPKRLQHQQMQRQYTWAHAINSTTPTSSGSFYGRRDFEGKREQDKVQEQEDGTLSSSLDGKRLHEQEEEDDDDDEEEGL